MKKALLLLLALVLMVFVREAAYAQDVGYAITKDKGNFASGQYGYEADIARGRSVIPKLEGDITRLKETLSGGDEAFDPYSISEFVDTYFNNY